MSSCVWLVDKLGRGVEQVGCLYALYTRPTYTSLFFMRRPSTNRQDLDTIFTRWFFTQNQSIKLSFTHFTHNLCIQINKESY